MSYILYIDACIGSKSRTRLLADYYLSFANKEIKHIVLEKEDLHPLNADSLQHRDALIRKQNFGDPEFHFARLLKEADEIVIAAPYWDQSFPALLKIFIERTNISGLTFRYTEQGRPISLIKAKKVRYFVTSGGPIHHPESGYGYIQNLFRDFYQIDDFKVYAAEMLDAFPDQVDEFIEKTKRQIEANLAK